MIFIITVNFPSTPYRQNLKTAFSLKMYHMSGMHTTPEKFDNAVFTLKTYQMFSVHTTWEKF